MMMGFGSNACNGVFDIEILAVFHHARNQSRD